MNYEQKYLKYKSKYNQLKNQLNSNGSGRENYTDIIRGKVYVENGIGFLLDQQSGNSSREVEFSKGYNECGKKLKLVIIKNKKGVTHLTERGNFENKFSQLDNSLVGKNFPEFSPSYIHIMFDDGTYGYYIHEKYVKQLSD